MSPVPMDWVEFMSARQLMSEERLGTAHRAVAQAEQETVEATKAAMRKAGLQPVVLMPRVPVQPPSEPLILNKGEIKRGRVA